MNQFSESYLGQLIFRTYDVKDFINLIYVYGRSNESTVQSVMIRLSELDANKFTNQFREELTSSLKRIKNNVKSLCTIAKSHFDKSGLTDTESWPKRIRECIDDSIYELKELYIMAKFFPARVAQAVWKSDVLIILANYY